MIRFGLFDLLENIEIGSLFLGQGKHLSLSMKVRCKLLILPSINNDPNINQNLIPSDNNEGITK